MELAADSISVKVSEAIMHMQENSVSISTKASKRAQKTLMHLYCFFQRFCRPAILLFPLKSHF